MPNFPTDREAREAILDIGRRMYERRFGAANDGNISIRVADGFWCTPTGVSKGHMTEDMLCKIDENRNILSGSRTPSSEIRMHLRVYREDENVVSVAHSHAPAATSFAAAGLPLDDALITEAVVTLGVVPLAPFALPSTEQVPDSVAPYIKGYSAVLLENHGVLTWGQDAFEAYYRMETVEHYAQILLNVRYLMGSRATISPDRVEALLGLRRKLGIQTGGTPGELGGCPMNRKEAR